jgi:single-strand DNA-binding protein
MSDGLNRATLLGNLGEDPEFRMTQNNRPVLKFRIATTESYKTESGEWKPVTHWHRVVLWGKRAEGLSKYLSKGSKVYVEGRIETRSYDDKDGVKRSVTEISATNIILLDRRGAGAGADAGDGGGRSAGGGGGGGYARAPAGGGGGGRAPSGGDEGPPDDFAGGDDDIPF